MATLLQITQFFDNIGSPLTAGVVYAYEAGTSTPKNMFADQSGTILGTSYTLSASGRVPTTGIWLEGAYKLIIKDSVGVTLYTLDNVEEYDSLDFSGLTATIADLNSTTTTALIKTSNYTVAVGDRGKTILANATSGVLTINLPAAATAGNKFIIRIKKTDVSANAVIIDPASTQTIDGLTTYQLLNYFDSVILQCDGSNWYIVAAKLRDTIQSITASRELKLANDIRLFLCDASSGAIDLKLPAPATVGKGWRVGAKKTDSSANIVTIKQNVAETIDGQTEIGLGNQYAAAEVITDGVNWYIANEYDDVSDEPYPPLTLNGLKTERDSGDPNHDIKFFSEGGARSAGDNYNINPSSPLVKRIDANWVEGTNQGGFPTALTLTANTCYHKFWITKPDGTLDAGFDSSLTATNLLADATGYADYVRVGSFYTDGASNIEPFIMIVDKAGRHFRWATPSTQVTANPPPITGTLGTMKTPVGIRTNAFLAVSMVEQSPVNQAYIVVYLSSPETTDLGASVPTITEATILTADGMGIHGTGGQAHVFTNTASQIRYRAQINDGSTTLYIVTLGWDE